MLTAPIRELVNQKTAHLAQVSHNDIEDILIAFYEGQGLVDVTVDDDELHDTVSELWADFAQRGRAVP